MKDSPSALFNKANTMTARDLAMKRTRKTVWLMVNNLRIHKAKLQLSTRNCNYWHAWVALIDNDIFIHFVIMSTYTRRLMLLASVMECTHFTDCQQITRDKWRYHPLDGYASRVWSIFAKMSRWYWRIKPFIGEQYIWWWHLINGHIITAHLGYNDYPHNRQGREYGRE